MLRLERERLGEVALEVGGALARDPVDEVEREVVEAGLPERVHRAADVLRARAPLEHLQQVRLEALRAERHAVDAVLAQQRGEAGVTVSGFASTVTSAAAGKRGEQPRERGRLGEGRRAAAEEDRLDVARERGRARARARRAARRRSRRARRRAGRR